jgi:hypothetical protein
MVGWNAPELDVAFVQQWFFWKVAGLEHQPEVAGAQLGRQRGFEARQRAEGEEFARGRLDVKERQLHSRPAQEREPEQPRLALRWAFFVRLEECPRALWHRAGIPTEARRQLEDEVPR